jgi:hypothetical protein
MPAVTENDKSLQKLVTGWVQRVRGQSKDNSACEVKCRQSGCFARQTLTLQALGKRASAPAFRAK